MSKYLEMRLIFQAVRCAEITFSRIHNGTRFRRNGVNISIRNAINKGIVKVRIFTAGKAIATTGGHADPTNGSNRKLVGDPAHTKGVITPEDAVKAVRERYKGRCHQNYCYWRRFKRSESGKNPQFTLKKSKPLTTAKDYNMLTAAHAHGDEECKRAILGGIKPSNMALS
jgi:imidazolonepropionase-like amidohydrolase